MDDREDCKHGCTLIPYISSFAMSSLLKDRDEIVRSLLSKLCPGFDPLQTATQLNLNIISMGTHTKYFIYPSDSMMDLLGQLLICMQSDETMTEATTKKRIEFLRGHIFQRKCCAACILKRSGVLLP
jgi:hypothetical protein